MSAFGLVESDLDDVAVWPDNLTAVNVFIAMSTQWRTGAMGATGLDYSVLPAVFRMAGVPRALWTDTFECLRILEGEALRTMSESK